jgi:hypothetical protein
VITYSRVNPDGTYEYYATPGMLAIGDDLPPPKLVPVNAIGASSVEAGRPIPPGARHVGHGSAAVGIVAPMDTATLHELGDDGAFGSARSWLAPLGWISFGAGVTWLAMKWKRKRGS